MEENNRDINNEELQKIESELSWFESFPEDDESIQAHLYKYNGAKRERLTRYDGHVPDSHDIGLEWGGGKYFYMVKRKGHEMKSRGFNVSLEYGTGTHKEDNSIADTTRAIPNSGVVEDVVNGITLAVERLLPVIVPILQPKENDSVANLMTGFYEKMGNAVSENFIKQQNVMLSGMKDTTKELSSSVRDIVDSNLVNQQVYAEPLEQVKDGDGMGKRVVKMAWKLIQPKIKQYVDGGGQGGIDLDAIKNNPLFKSIVGDAGNLELLADMVAETFGDEVLDSLEDSVAELVS